MAKAYRVKHWDQHFEKAQTRNVRLCTWVPVPNKHDGKGYRRLIRAKDGESLYGVWILILQIASKCPVRGTLVDLDGQALTPADMADKTGVKEKLFETALKLLCSKEIDWMEQIDAISTSQHADSASQCTDSTSQHDATIGNGMVWNGMGGQDMEVPPTEDCSEPPQIGDSKQPPVAEVVFLNFPVVGGGPTEWPLLESNLDEFEKAYPGVDVRGESRKAALWCEKNPSRRKTPAGMDRFLMNWFSKAQNSTKGHSQRPEQFSGLRTFAEKHGVKHDAT